MELTPFTDLLAAMRRTEEGGQIQLPPDWLQGRTAYGGLSAALCLHATLLEDDLPPLRSAQFTFVGPATGDLHVRPQVLRRGKSAVIVCADLDGDDGLAVKSILTFGRNRPSAHAHQGLVAPVVPPPQACGDYYSWPGLANFMRHFEGRLVSGSRPCVGETLPSMAVWLRHRDAGDDASLVRLLALADALPPAALALSSAPHPISTMTWSLDLVCEQPRSASGWWLVDTHAETSAQGYSVQSTVIWNDVGEAILVARQCVAIFG